MTCVRRQSVRNAARRPSGARGFTLIEVLMAAFVMAIGVLGLTALFAGAARQQQLSSQSTRSVAHARSADAYISGRFGPIEAVVDNGKLRPPVTNNQTPINEVQTDQWYALPRSPDGSISVNPDEAKNGWKNESLFTRSEPREVLPKLLFRTRMERRAGEVIATGRPGGDRIGQTGFGTLDDTANGAPALGQAMQEIRELRVIADSIKIRVITRAFPCAGSATSADERSLTAPDDREIVLTWDGVEGTNGEIRLEGDDGASEAIVQSKRDAKDADLGTTNGQSRLSYIYIDDVIDGIDDPSCGTAEEYLVATQSTPSECDNDATTQYLWTATTPGTGDYDLDLSPGSGIPGYDIKQGTTDSEQYLYAQLRKVDRCNTGSAIYVKAPGTGTYVASGDGVNPPPNGTGPAIPVRTANFPDRFIHEIWLVDYRYRAHTLVSMPESVTYAQSTEDAGLRVPQLGYSMLFRRTADANVQYALFSYAISPTYPPTADKADNTEDDYFPREDAQAITGDRSAPIQLVQDVALEFDEDLGLYYVRISPASKIASIGWVASPGQVLLFNGDSSANPPIPGADAPVRVVNTRKIGSGELRAYLDGPPRAGLRALPDFGADKTFDAWVIAPKCEVTQRKPGKMIYYWGLKPVEARIFTVGQ